MTRTVSPDSVDGKLAMSGLKSFVKEDLMIDPVLCTPVKLIWSAYLQSCRTWGFPAIDLPQFLELLDEMDGIRVRIGGPGRIKHMISGAYLRVHPS